WAADARRRRKNRGLGGFGSSAATAAVAVAAVLAGCSDVVESPAGAAAPTRHIGPQGDFGQFVVECSHSHSRPDDPIVFPGQPGRSHEHDFFGNTITDASSAVGDLLGAPTTCDDRRDTASYWSPQLIVNGEPVVPSRSTAYYRVAPGVDPTSVEP